MANNPTLYTREMKGNKRIYVEYKQPAPELIVNDALTPEEIVTMVGTMGICLIHTLKQTYPEHSKIFREVSVVEKAILEMYKSTGQKINKEIVEYAVTCWNKAVKNMESGVDNELQAEIGTEEGTETANTINNGITEATTQITKA